MDLTTLTLGSRQYALLQHMLEMQLDMHFDNMPDTPSSTELLDLQLLVDVCDKADVAVSKEVRTYLADRRR